MPSAASVASRVGWRIATWLPFTIVCSLIVFCWGVLSFSLALQHNMIHLSRWWKGMSELVLTQFLAGMTLWSFLAAVFTNPGTSTNNVPVEPEIDDRDFEELGASRRISKSGSRSSRPTSTVEHDPEWDEQEVSAPLLPNSGPAGISRLLPGQPQLPARTGRQQFDDLMNGAAASATALEEPVQNGRRRAANLMVKSSGDARWCGKCDAAKPDRAHHCSTCGICVLRMDHHCPWLASSCVGLRNHKPFFLFLFYTSAFCVYGFQETARALVAFVNDEPDGFENSPIAWAAVLFTGFIFGLALVPFTAYHAYLICRNRTTIESLEGSGRIRIRSELEAGGKAAERPRIKHRLRDLMRRSVDASQATMRVDLEEDGDVQWKTDEALTREERQALKRAGKVNVYDLGVSENWRQIMGTQPLFWFVPIGYPDSDGFSYMIDVAKLEKIQRITDAVRGVRYPAQGQDTRPRTYAEDQSQQSFTLFNADEEPDEHR